MGKNIAIVLLSVLVVFLVIFNQKWVTISFNKGETTPAPASQGQVLAAAPPVAPAVIAPAPAPVSPATVTVARAAGESEFAAYHKKGQEIYDVKFAGNDVPRCVTVHLPGIPQSMTDDDARAMIAKVMQGICAPEEGIAKLPMDGCTQTPKGEVCWHAVRRKK